MMVSKGWMGRGIGSSGARRVGTVGTHGLELQFEKATIQFELAECPADDPYCTPFARKK